MGSNSYHNLRIFSFRLVANLPKPLSLRWRPPLFKQKATILEFATIDIPRSLNFLIKGDIVNDTFPWSCCLIVSATRRIRYFKISLCPRSEKFNIVSNDHGHKQKCEFCVSLYRTNFTDHHTPNTTHGFGLFWSVKYTTVTVRYAKISSISVPFHQAMQAITMGRLDENKPLQNDFKRI